jgi:mannosylglucosylglycerate synthase
MSKRIGFISTRFAGSDGVSLESAKWSKVFWQDRHISFWYSGLSDRYPGSSYCIPEAFFAHPENIWINERIWGKRRRDRFVTERIRQIADYLKGTLFDFVDYHKIDVIIAENALTIPMHVPLGIALTEFLAETNMPAIAHHHDFYWERTRFSISAVKDYLDMAFPPTLQNIRHTVINQAAQEQLSLRKGVGALLVPNVFEFEKPPPKPDEYSADLRQEIGLKKDDVFILQPTRIVPRKGIEHAIKLVAALEDSKYKLVISHHAGDEGIEYKHTLQELAHEENVDLRFIADRVGEVRQFDLDGKKIYTLWDLYANADLVTYPSIYEGFGNALLEAFYFKLPVIINRYSTFIQDIEPKGFNVIVMNGFITKETINRVRCILNDSEYRKKMVDHNYRLARQYYGYDILKRSLRILLGSLTGWTPDS